MKFRTTWILIAVFGALGAYLYFVDEPRERKAAARKESEGLLLPRFDPGRVTQVVLDGKRGRIRLTKGAGDRWSAVEPVADAADSARVRTLLDEVKSLRADKEVAGAGADLKPFGLDAPEVAVTTVGDAVTVAIGSANPAGDGRYVRVSAGPVVIVKSYALEGLMLAPGDLRSRELVRGFPWDKLQSLTIAVPGAPAVKLAKASGRWRLEAPAAYEADPDAADALVEKLRWGKIANFAPAGAKVEAALAAGLAVSLTAEGLAEPAVLRLAQTDGAVWGRTSGRDTVFTVDKDLLDAFRAKPADLRRMKPVLVKTWSAEKLELTGGGKSARYEKSEGAWRRGGAAVRGEEGEALQQLLQTLEEEKASRMLDAPGSASQYGLDAPRVTLTLADSQYPAQTLEVGEKGGTLYARAGKAGPVYVLAHPEYLARLLAVLKLASAGPKAVAEAAPAGKP
ncbi:MAG: DUF4340 domain-containing protein [Deltaproteobacteria bacterium]|nr:DUF4340 domain-containing protein [Deltaproteobacteria bacterium]